MLVQEDGGYYTQGEGPLAYFCKTSAIGGQGGGPCWGGDSGNTNWYKDKTGDGGHSGSGGEVYYSQLENIFAFNGDMITNGDYNATYYEYNKDGTQDISKILQIYERNDLNGSSIKFIPTKIFAQSGVIRKTYTTNQGQFTLDKVTRILGKGESLPNIARKADDVVVVLATEETLTAITNYINPLAKELENQGIGSGAGYLEAENGIFEKIAD